MFNIGKKINNESGMILMASTMGIFIILSIFAFYLARFSITETRSGAYHILDIKARNLAMTGAEHGMQLYKSSRSTEGININNITGNLNNGSYAVSFDSDNDEVNSALPYTHYLTMKSSATIDDVKRNIRFILSSLPEAFCFSFYGNNTSSQVFSETGSYINGDMFFNGSVGSGSGTSNGVTYISTGSGGTLLPAFPEFPQLEESIYTTLLNSAAAVSGGNSAYTNYSYQFDGIDDYVTIGSSNDINQGEFPQKTIEVWFKTNDKSNKQVIYEQGGGSRGLNLYINDSKLYAGGWNRVEGNWNPGTWLLTSAISNNQWHHVALTLNGDETKSAGAFKFYLDGELKGTGEGSQLWNHHYAVIGKTRSKSRYDDGTTSSGFTFNGFIDEVRLWNTERSLSEIVDNKDKVLSGYEKGLVAYYNFQEETGSIANDSDPNSPINNGTISGAVINSTGQTLSSNILSFKDETVILSNYTDSKLLVNQDLLILGSSFNGPGYIVVNGNITIGSTDLNTSTINGNIFIICSGSITIKENSQIGTSIDAPVILYSKGNGSYFNSTIYGLVVSKGDNLLLNETNVNGAILNYSASFSLTGDSDVIGSVVSYYSVDIQGNDVSITKGNIPEFSGLVIGLDPFVVPGSYLEY